MRRAAWTLVLVVFLVACGGPGPTPTPAFARHKADDVWRALAAAGLPVGGWRDNATVGTSLVPHTWREAREFTIGDGSAGGGQVFTFATPGDEAAVRDWFAATPAFSPYVYTRDDALLWVSGYIPKVEAERYRAALAAMP